MANLKTIFFGTPQLAVPYLELVKQCTDLQLAVTQADKPRGRGMEISTCPVKARALELGVSVLYTLELTLTKDDEGTWKLNALTNEQIKKIQGMY